MLQMHAVALDALIHHRLQFGFLVKAFLRAIERHHQPCWRVRSTLCRRQKHKAPPLVVGSSALQPASLSTRSTRSRREELAAEGRSSILLCSLRRRFVNSSRYHTENEPELVQLPLIKGSCLFPPSRLLDTPYADQTALVIQKLQQCQKIFDFYDPVAQLKSKEVGDRCISLLIVDQTSGPERAYRSYNDRQRCNCRTYLS